MVGSKVSMETQTDSLPLKEEGRSCAFCLLPLSPEEVRKCGKCHRRAYCSRECQKADWKGKGGFGPVASGNVKGIGQGHKRWCGLAVGEEGLDWAIREIPGKGHGLVALRDLPPLYRIIVEGMQKGGQAGLADHPGFKALPEPAHPDCFPGGTEMARKFFAYATTTTVQYKQGGLGFRQAWANHACDANAAQLPDAGLHVMYLFSNRKILAGEEIFIQYKQFNEISFLAPLIQPEYLTSSLFKHGIVCPPSCLCKDIDLRSKLEEMSALILTYPNLVQQVGNLAAYEEALGNILKALAIGEEIGVGSKLSPNTMANLHFAALEASCLRQEFWMQAKEHYNKVLEFSQAVIHPESPNNFEQTQLARTMKHFYSGECQHHAEDFAMDALEASLREMVRKRFSPCRH